LGVGRQYLAAVEAFETLFVGMVMPIDVSGQKKGGPRAALGIPRAPV
jgi:hypothetical protein